MIKLSIIILSFNTKKLTLACIKSIQKHYKKELVDGELEIVVVDNASTDDTVNALKRESIKVIQNKTNVGFAKGSNIGTAYAKGENLFFLNSDTIVEDRGLFGMVSFLDDQKEVGVLGARLVNTDGTAQASTGVFYNLAGVFLMLLGGERAGFLRKSPSKKEKVDWVSGGAMMVKRHVFEKLHGFDEAFFMYVEDLELCFRARKEGFSTYFYPDVTIVHKQLGSSNRSFAITSIYKGLLHFYKKHASYGEYVVVKVLLVAKATVAIIIGTMLGNNYLTSTYKKALSLSL